MLLPLDFARLEMDLPNKGIYRHFKGGRYELLDFARHSESEEMMVVYRALYGDKELWVRPLSMWNEQIERDGKRYTRFLPEEEFLKQRAMENEEMVDEKKSLLKRIYGYDSFREGQEEVVDAVLSGRDTLAILPTGAGKSLCYQLPAMMFSGISIVVSPLISLMKDQVNALTQAGVPAAYLNRSLTDRQFDAALKRMALGQYRIVYVAPERLLTPRFLQAVAQVKVAMIAVDEAHCISQWGQEFRPSYLEIPAFISKFPERPRVCAFTATATDRVKDDIIRLLEMQDPYVRMTGFDRPNLYFSVSYTREKDRKLMQLMELYRGFSGIVYCATRKGVESVCEKLQKNGYAATRYHAGLSEEERHCNQEAFIYDNRPIMVATNAFGMGIDKSNVRFVIHYNMPKDLESYYQEAGRAGRDGERSDCHLLFDPSDAALQNFLIDKLGEDGELDPVNLKSVQERARFRLQRMVDYCRTTQCLRRHILRYFGEGVQEGCKYCSNCLEPRNVVDVTEAARLYAGFVREVDGRFGNRLVMDVLRGKESERIRSLRLNDSSYFGALKGMTLSNVQFLADEMIENNILSVDAGTYPLLRLGKNVEQLIDGECRVYAYQENTAPNRKNAQINTVPEDVDEKLFDELRKERLKLSRSRSIPPYAICSDATLIDMCRRKPNNRDELRFVKGMGESKIRSFGDSLIRIIRKHAKN